MDTLPKTPSAESEKQGYAKIERKLDETNHTLAQMQKENEMMRVKAQEQSDEQDRLKKMHERERADDIEIQEELKSAIDKLDKKVSRLAKKDRSQRVSDHAIFQMPKPPTSKPDNRDDDKDPNASGKTFTP